MDPNAAPFTKSDSTFTAHDGLKLRIRHWPPSGERKGLSVAIVHGVGEHSGRYGHVVEHLTSAGFDVHAFDLRGHGESDGVRVHVDRWLDYRQDVARYLETVAQLTGNAPIMLYGHSLGALIVLDFLIETIPVTTTPPPIAPHPAVTIQPPRTVPPLHAVVEESTPMSSPTSLVGTEQESSESADPPSVSHEAAPFSGRFAGAILSGAPLQPAAAAQPVLILAARLLSALWPTVRLPLRVDPSALSRDEKVVISYRQDPLVEWKGTARWGAEALATLRRVRNGLGKITCPLLILHGEADRVSHADGSRTLLDQVSSRDKRLRIYPDGAHEPHNDFGYQQVLADVQHWLDEHCSASPSTIRGAEGI